MIRVAVVEDSAIIRRSLEAIINKAPGMQCVCACDTAEDALRRLPRATPDVVLMDIQLPNLSGIECTAELKQLLPSVQIIMVTVYEDTDRIFKALKAGACGYLLKRSTPEQIVAAIAEVQQGGAPMTSEIARKVIATFQSSSAYSAEVEALSRRELEILDLVSQGYSNKEIAGRLSLSGGTVHWHLKNIYEKLHVHSRTQAVVKFKQNSGGPPPG